MELYHRCRLGGPGEAVQLAGQWAQAHADEQPQFAADFYFNNRRAYRTLADRMVWQYPAHLEQLADGYLELPDGGCCLPVAYTLTYGYWGQKRLATWIDQLDARLEDARLSGDARVNWLLARAQAEEIRHSPASPYWLTRERSLAGLAWIQEATLVAESEPVVLRAHQELSARFTAREQLDGARQMLAKAEQRCTSAPSAQLLATWRGELDGLNQAFQERHQQRESLARQAYLDRLNKRHQAAAARGDSRAASGYERLLNETGS
jgi:hypothetical protein